MIVLVSYYVRCRWFVQYWASPVQTSGGHGTSGSRNVRGGVTGETLVPIITWMYFVGYVPVFTFSDYNLYYTVIPVGFVW